MTQAQLIDWLTSAGWQLAAVLVPIALSVLGFYGARLIDAQAKAIDAKRGDTVATQIEAEAFKMVDWVEQTIAANPEKKAAVMQFVQAYCDARGWKIPVTKLEAIVEAQVLRLPPTHDAPASGVAPAPSETQIPFPGAILPVAPPKA